MSVARSTIAPTNRPQRAGAGGLRLTPAHLSKLLGEARASYKVPAIAVAAMNSEAVYLQHVQGTRVFDSPSQATLDDYFHVGSCSKSVLALMAARLVEQRKIAWRTGFFELFPELKASADDAYHGITLEDLLLCEAGIKAYTDGAETFPGQGLSASHERWEFMKYLVGLPPSAPKEHGRFRHVYSNASYTLASAMLEGVCGLDYEELVKKTLTGDLGLPVHVGWPNDISADQPWGHTIAGARVDAFAPGHAYRIPRQLRPAGDLSMTPRSYAKYTQLHLRGLRGEDNLVCSRSYRRIHFGHERFSLGVANGTLGGRRFSGFDGSAGTFFCRSIVVPESDFAFTVMMNAGSGSASMAAADWLTMQIVKKHFGWWWKVWLSIS